MPIGDNIDLWMPPDMMAACPPDAMQGMDADMMAAMPPDAMSAMGPDMMAMQCHRKQCRVWTLI